MSGPTFVNSATHHQTALNSNAVAYSGTAGNGLIVFFSTATVITSLSVSDSAGNTYSNPLVYTNGGAGSAYIAVFYCQSLLTTGSITITLNWTTNAQSVITVGEYSGAGPFDAVSTVQHATSSTYATGTSPAPAVSGELAISFVGTNTATSPTFSAPTNGYTTEFQTNAGPSMAFSDLIVSAATSSGGTISGSIGWASCVLLFKPAGIITLVSSHAGSFSGTSGTYLLTEAIALNDLILVQWDLNNASNGAAPAITDSVNSGPYTVAGIPYFHSSNTQSWCQSFIACNTAGAAPTLTINLSGVATNAQYLISHYTGFTLAPTLDALIQITGTAASFSNSATTAFANELAVTNTFANQLIASTPSGWTTTSSGGNGSIDQTYYQLVPSAGGISVGVTLNASADFANWLLSFSNGQLPFLPLLGQILM